MKRTISLLLCLLLAASLFSGCTNTGSPSQTPGNTSQTPGKTTTPDQTDKPAPEYPIVDDGSITLKIMFSMPSEAAPYVTDFMNGPNIAWPEISRRTGINLDMFLPLDSTYSEQMNLVIASGDLPDVMQCTAYAGGFDKAYQDEVFIRLNEYEDIMPNYMSWVNHSEVERKAAYTDGGNLMAFSQVYNRMEAGWCGYYIRQDWLDDLGLDKPETVDDWYSTLVSFRDNKTGGAGPLELHQSGMPFSNFFTGAYNVAYGYNGSNPFIKTDGKIIYTPTTEGMRGYLTMMNQWFSENLIEEDYLNHTNPMYGDNTRIGTNKTGATHLIDTASGTYYSDMGTAEPGAYFATMAVPSLSGEHVKVRFKGDDSALLGATGWRISFDSKYKEESIRFLDYFYGEDGAILTNYGIENETFNYVDSKPLLTELFTKNDSLSPTGAQQVYLIHNGFILSVDRMEAVMSEEALKYNEYWGEPGEYNFSAPVSYTPEEETKRATMGNDISTYVSEMIGRFITGTVVINDSNWNTYLNTLEGMGVAEYTAITQASYDRWLAK